MEAMKALVGMRAVSDLRAMVDEFSASAADTMLNFQEQACTCAASAQTICTCAGQT